METKLDLKEEVDYYDQGFVKWVLWAHGHLGLLLMANARAYPDVQSKQFSLRENAIY